MFTNYVVTKFGISVYQDIYYGVTQTPQVQHSKYFG
jgi:hypothetical protein